LTDTKMRQASRAQEKDDEPATREGGGPPRLNGGTTLAADAEGAQDAGARRRCSAWRGAAR
jgi:hypothetical protein